MMKQGWNEVPEALGRLSPAEHKQTSGFKLYALLAALLLAVSWSGVLPGIVAYAAAALCGVLALKPLLMPHQPPSEWEAKLGPQQRRLLGMPPGATKPAAPTAGATVPPPAVAISPPQRSKPIVAAQTVDAAARTSPAVRSAGRQPPYPAAGQVTTPQQLQPILREFEKASEATRAAAEAAAAADYAYSYTAPAPGAGLFSSPAAGSPGGMMHGGSGLPSPLSAGGASTYRPSAVQKDNIAAPVRSDGRVMASSHDALRALLSTLDETERGLEEGTDRLRQWMAATVLKPLVSALGTAHSNVVDTAARLGWTGVQLSPLTDVPLGEPSERPGARADDELIVAQLREQLQGRMQALGSMPPPPEAKACMEAVYTYQQLAALLRGDLPPSLLPNSPQGYLTSRISELAEGSCMAAFKWDGGGSYNSKPWSSDLPTDSAVLLYLFAAFLAAPHWVFPQDAMAALSGPASTLYLGKPPTRPSGTYFAVLSTQPQHAHRATAVVGLQLGTTQPMFMLLLNGDPAFTASGSAAALQAIVLFVKYCRKAAGGMLGGRSLQYLGLDRVARPVRLRFLPWGGTMRLLAGSF